MIVRSKDAIALVTLAMVKGSDAEGNAAGNIPWYTASERSACTSAPSVAVQPSSTGCSPNIGVRACFSRLCSFGLLHVNTELYASLTRLIAPRGCNWPVAPTACGFPSVKASSCRWQLAHDSVPFSDIRLL